MVYAYVSPFVILIVLFISTFFVIDWSSKWLLYVFIINLVVMPGYLLYKEETR